MKTAEEIIAYLEEELADAYKIHKEVKGKNACKSLTYLIKANTIEQLLEEIDK